MGCGQNHLSESHDAPQVAIKLQISLAVEHCGHLIDNIRLLIVLAKLMFMVLFGNTNIRF